MHARARHSGLDPGLVCASLGSGGQAPRVRAEVDCHRNNPAKGKSRKPSLFCSTLTSSDIAEVLQRNNGRISGGPSQTLPLGSGFCRGSFKIKYCCGQKKNPKRHCSSREPLGAPVCPPSFAVVATAKKFFHEVIRLQYFVMVFVIQSSHELL